MGVSVETAVILVSYINKLRLENDDIRTATREAALCACANHETALVACLAVARQRFQPASAGHAEAIRDRHCRGT